MLFHLKWHQSLLLKKKMFKTASKIRIYLRMEGNIIFQGWDAIKKSILFLL